MGFFGSSEERVEEKTVDSNGHVNNNIVIQEARDIHSQMLYNEKLLYATFILVVFEVIKLAIHLFNSYRKRIKKIYKGAHPA